jgi:hypothetical protein
MTERDIQGNFAALRELFLKFPNDLSDDETKLFGELVLKLLEGAFLDLNQTARATEELLILEQARHAQARAF